MGSLNSCLERANAPPWRELIRGSDPRHDVGHKVSVDPVDVACIDISHLEQRWDLGVSGTAIDPDDISHPPGTFRVSDDHSHPGCDVQKDGV